MRVAFAAILIQGLWRGWETLASLASQPQMADFCPTSLTNLALVAHNITVYALDSQQW